jgi:hypothetical protein
MAPVVPADAAQQHASAIKNLYAELTGQEYAA